MSNFSTHIQNRPLNIDIMSLTDLEIFVIMKNFNEYEDGILFIKRFLSLRYSESR